MRQKLDDQGAIILQTRMNIARAAKIFTHLAVAKEWGMSTATLYRYVSPEYRELSRDTERRQREKEVRRDALHCYKCRQLLATHERCLYCTILIHGKQCDCESKFALTRGKSV